MELLKDLSLSGQSAVQTGRGSHQIVPGVGALQDIDGGDIRKAVGAEESAADIQDGLKTFGVIRRVLQPSVELETPTGVPQQGFANDSTLAHGAQHIGHGTLRIPDLPEFPRVSIAHVRSPGLSQAAAE